MITTKSGIHAASQFLRHSDIQVTAMHYADHKERVTVDIGGMLRPENVTLLDSSATVATTVELAKNTEPLLIAG